MYNEGLSPIASALLETTADAMFEGGQLANELLPDHTWFQSMQAMTQSKIRLIA